MSIRDTNCSTCLHTDLLAAARPCLECENYIGTGFNWKPQTPDQKLSPVGWMIQEQLEASTANTVETLCEEIDSRVAKLAVESAGLVLDDFGAVVIPPDSPVGRALVKRGQKLAHKILHEDSTKNIFARVGIKRKEVRKALKLQIDREVSDYMLVHIRGLIRQEVHDLIGAEIQACIKKLVENSIRDSI